MSPRAIVIGDEVVLDTEKTGVHHFAISEFPGIVDALAAVDSTATTPARIEAIRAKIETNPKGFWKAFAALLTPAELAAIVKDAPSVASSWVDCSGNLHVRRDKIGDLVRVHRNADVWHWQLLGEAPQAANSLRAAKEAADAELRSMGWVLQ